ncbi:MAG: RNA-binding protein [Saprospiraceae bacterium]|nr:RNA-binding protein [Saprospiraceae bacterium]
MTIFVSKLNNTTQSEELLRMFGAFGSVSSAEVMVDKLTGRSRGFGFVEMDSEDEATNAIEQLHNSDMNGMAITVKKAPKRT